MEKFILDVRMLNPELLNLIEIEVGNLPTPKAREYIKECAKLIRTAADETGDKYHFVCIAKRY